jgi:hypothetical protein
LLRAGWLVRGFRLVRLSEKASMGVSAFTLLIAAEAALGVFVFGIPFADWLAGLFRMPGVIGLAGQAAFGVIPMLRTE